MIFLRNGAYRWHLYEDLKQPNKFRMEVVVPSWKQHILQRERMTKDAKEVIDKLRGLRTNPNSPKNGFFFLSKRKFLTRELEPEDCRRSMFSYVPSSFSVSRCTNARIV